MVRCRLPTLLALVVAVFGSEQSFAQAAFLCARPEAAVDPVMVIGFDLNGAPAVVRIPKIITKPPIVLWHGFGPPASEKALMDALPLDDVPAIKVYLGLPLFGARAPAGGVEEIVRRQKEDLASLIFEPAVMGAAKELPAIVKALTARDCMGPQDKIGLFGFSAGGAAVLYALAQKEVPVSAAVTVNASTGLSASVAAYERATKQQYKWTARAREIAKHSDAPARAADIAAGNSPPALLIVHGAEDAMLTPQTASALYEALLPLYRKGGNDSRLRLDVEPGLSHAWATASNADELRRSIAQWFNANLG